jgi:ankyrin repeat protein
MPESPLLRALYEGRKADAAAHLATDPELDVFEAAAAGRSERVRALVSADPSLATAWTDDGFTALHYAAFFGDIESARVLLDAGADVGAVARNQMLVQPLHSAAAAHAIDICRLLLERGADPNARQQNDYTPLDEADMTNQAELRELLLQFGASAR